MYLTSDQGGATIMKLQHLIKMDYFPYAHPDMIRSVTAGFLQLAFIPNSVLMFAI